MNTRMSVVLLLAVFVPAAAAWCQDLPPSQPMPAATPAAPSQPAYPPPAPYAAAPGAYAAPPSGYAAPPSVSAAPPGGYAAPPSVSAAPPGGYAAPPSISAAPPSAYSTPTPYTPPPPGYVVPPPAYRAPPGGVLVAPGQPYPYAYPPSGPYPGPVIVAPPSRVFTPAPPLPSDDWNATVDAFFLARSSGGSIPLAYSYANIGGTSSAPGPAIDGLYSDDSSFGLTAGLRLEISRRLESDFTIAATYWGLQHWSEGDFIDAGYLDPYGNPVFATSPYFQLPSFDQSISYTYSSQIENVEVNVLRQPVEFQLLGVQLAVRHPLSQCRRSSDDDRRR